MKDGGPAFPAYKMHGLRDFVPTTGMSLRDWFAGMALQAVISRASLERNIVNDDSPIASIAYKIADKMIAARDAT